MHDCTKQRNDYICIEEFLIACTFPTQVFSYNRQTYTTIIHYDRSDHAESSAVEYMVVLNRKLRVMIIFTKKMKVISFYVR